MKGVMKHYTIRVILLSLICIILSISSGHTDTFLKLYCIPKDQNSYGYVIYSGSPLMSPDGKIVLNLDPFGNGTFFVKEGCKQDRLVVVLVQGSDKICKNKIQSNRSSDFSAKVLQNFDSLWYKT